MSTVGRKHKPMTCCTDNLDRAVTFGKDALFCAVCGAEIRKFKAGDVIDMRIRASHGECDCEKCKK